MTTTSKSQRKPARPATPPFKYILEIFDGGIALFEDRPTMDYVKETYGEGEHTLSSNEGKVLRYFTVSLNRNSNLKITGVAPTGLEAVSTLNLHRLIKQYIRIVKVWPAKMSDAKSLQKELARRETLIEDAFQAYEAQADIPPVDAAVTA